jgi:HSP20 family protein
MRMTRWNPVAELAAIERSVDTVLSGVFGPRSKEVGEPAYFRLPVDIEQAEGKYLITAPVAGFKPEEIEITFAEGTLTISAKHSEEKKDDRNGYVRREVVSGSFYRQIPVGDIDPSSITAKVENGVLTVSLPAPVSTQPVKIAINPASSRDALESGNAEQPAAQSA